MPPAPTDAQASLLPPPPAGRLYAIVDAEICEREGRLPLAVARAFLSAGATLIQLRCKSMASGAFLELASTVVDDAQQAGATIIINDRADIALVSRAHGLHVGQTDLTPADARLVIGDRTILGLSTHTEAQWVAALREPVSYVAIGPVYATGTKDTGYTAVGLATVSQASSAAASSGLPTTAIGGITLDTAAAVIDAGASSVAVITDLLKGDPEARCRAFLNALR